MGVVNKVRFKQIYTRRPFYHPFYWSNKMNKNIINGRIIFNKMNIEVPAECITSASTVHADIKAYLWAKYQDDPDVLLVEYKHDYWYFNNNQYGDQCANLESLLTYESIDECENNPWSGTIIDLGDLKIANYEVEDYDYDEEAEDDYKEIKVSLNWIDKVVIRYDHDNDLFNYSADDLESEDIKALNIEQTEVDRVKAIFEFENDFELN